MPIPTETARRDFICAVAASGSCHCRARHGRKNSVADRASLVDPPEYRTAPNVSSVEPIPERLYRACLNASVNRNGDAFAFLVRFGTGDRHAEAFGDLLNMRHLQRDELRAPECTGKAEQEQGPIPLAANVSAQLLTIALIRPATAGAFLTLADPMVRRIPRSVALTASASVGVGKDASLWAYRMAAVRRLRVEALRPSATP
jgi:hypothetical protein